MSTDSTTLKHCSKCNRELPATVEYFPTRADSKDGLRGHCRECCHERRIKFYSEHREEAKAYTRKWEQDNKEKSKEAHQKWAREHRDNINQRNKEKRQQNPEQYREYNRRWRAANPEKVAENSRLWQKNNPEKSREKVRRSYQKHREARLQQGKVYREANPDKRKEQWRSWYTANAEDVREYRRLQSQTPEAKAVRQKYLDDNAERIRERSRKYGQTPQGKAANSAAVHKRRARKLEAGGTCTASDLTAIRAAQTDKKGRLICWRCGKQIKGTPHLDHWIPLVQGGTNDPGNLHYMHAKCNLSKGAKLPTELGRLL